MSGKIWRTETVTDDALSTGGEGGAIVKSARATSARTTVGRLQSRYPLVQGIALIALFIFGSVTLDGFSSYTSIKAVLIITSFLGIAAVGQQVVLLLGGIDLGVPAFMAFGNFFVPQLWGIDHWPFVWALVLQILIAIVLGSASGYICSHFKVESMVVTFGVQSIVIGGVAVWTNGLVDAGAPTWMSNLTNPSSDTLGVNIPPVVVIWAIIAIMMAVLLYRTRLGRKIYASGSNPTAAAYALLPIDKVWMFAFALSAVAASVSGLLIAGFSGPGNLSIGNSYLFTSLAAVIVGGTALAGAKGDYWRTVIGALLLTVLTTILIGHGLGDAGQQIFYGAVILVVVPAYGRDRRTADRV